MQITVLVLTVFMCLAPGQCETIEQTGFKTIADCEEITALLADDDRVKSATCEMQSRSEDK
jgi:hypothetical protein